MKKIEVLCFGGNDWWYHNRNHFDVRIVELFAKKGNVLYINSIVMQKPGLGQGRGFTKKLIRKAKSMMKGLQKSDVGFWVYSPFSLPVHHIGWLRPINEIILRLQLWQVTKKLNMHNPIVWVACPAACDLAVKKKKVKLVYQRTDRFEEYPNVDGETIKQYDRKLKTHADLTLFVNRTLYDEEASQCKNAVYLDHGVDYEMFATVEKDTEIPTEIKDITRPIVGFFGGIDDHTVDIKLLKNVIMLLPAINFVFVGKASVDCSDILSKKNVWLLGQKPYEQIPHYGKCFDVAIMPWRQNKWIQACNPIKLKEYLALGKPIVSTPFSELQKYLDVVYEAGTPEEFAEYIKRALLEDNPERIAARRKKVEKATWDSRVQLVFGELFGNEQVEGGTRQVDE